MYIAALQDIGKGEATINYRYNLTLAPTWYRLAWAKYQKSGSAKNQKWQVAVIRMAEYPGHPPEPACTPASADLTCLKPVIKLALNLSVTF